ncbi:hypothetical protein [Streptomyces pharetrae]|uniref:hypothetical protein n=1 Tax=Streptomyces pharetrae TaxID=291370 RepID=UPI00369AABB2
MIATAEPALFVIVEPPVLGAPHGVSLKQASGQRLARLGRTLGGQSLGHRPHGLLRHCRVAENRQEKEETGVRIGDACRTRWCLQ